MKLRLILAGVLINVATAWAQPSIYANGVMNAASYALPGLPNSSIAQGSLFVVYGKGLGPDNLVSSGYPLQTNLSGTSINVNGANALIADTSAGLVVALLPSGTPLGTGQLTLTYNGQPSAPISVNVVKSSLGAFAINMGGSGPGVITDANYAVKTAMSPAKPGDVVMIWGTGLGPVSGDESAGALPGDLSGSIPVDILIGTQHVKPIYAGRSGCCAGLDQIVFTVPDGVQGCFVNIIVSAGGVPSNAVSLAVDPGGNACSDPNGFFAADVARAQNNGSVNLGSISLTRNVVKLLSTNSSVTVTSDTAIGLFGTYSAAELVASQGTTQAPSPGSCAVTTFRGLDPTPVDPVKPSALDAGRSLQVSGGKPGLQTLPATQSGVYSGVLGGVSIDAIITPPKTIKDSYLDPGNYTVAGGGGVGSFSASIAIPKEVSWTNNTIVDVYRNQDLTIKWSPGGDPNSFVSIIGVASTGGDVDPKTKIRTPTKDTPGAAFLCVARAGDGQFTIPSAVLQSLPVTPNDTVIGAGYLLVGSSSAPVKFTASGLDSGYLTYRVLNGKNVNYK